MVDYTNKNRIIAKKINVPQTLVMYTRYILKGYVKYENIPHMLVSDINRIMDEIKKEGNN